MSLQGQACMLRPQGCGSRLQPRGQARPGSLLGSTIRMPFGLALTLPVEWPLPLSQRLPRYLHPHTWSLELLFLVNLPRLAGG